MIFWEVAYCRYADKRKVDYYLIYLLDMCNNGMESTPGEVKVYMKCGEGLRESDPLCH